MLKIFLILVNLTIGSVLLIAGVRFMSNALETAGKEKIKRSFRRKQLTLTKAFIISIIATILTQSSTAVMVITLGIVNSGIIDLTSAMGIIYGANIGTTFTAHLISLNISNYALFFLVIGIVLKIKFKTAGDVILGLGLMFCGIKVLNYSIPYIQQSKEAYYLLSKYGNNIPVAFFAGIIITMLVQSSSAAVGLTMMLFNGGFISLNAAIALVLGDNIGTCVTSQIASIGTDINTKRVALAHTIYNIAGSIIALILIIPFAALITHITNILAQDSSKLIPNTHTVFNILSALIFLPINKWYVKIIEKIIK